METKDVSNTNAGADLAIEHDDGYRERNQLVAYLSRLYPSHMAEGDDPAWPIVYIESPAGQLSWHIPAEDVPDLFPHLEWAPSRWDGHSTEEKYRRLRSLLIGG